MQNENINDDRSTYAVSIFKQIIALMSALDSAADMQENSVEFEFDPKQALNEASSSKAQFDQVSGQV